MKNSDKHNAPLAIDLYCGLGGWAEGFLAEGFEVVGFDIEYRPYPGELVLQDVLTLHGSQFREASVIVASPPCQGYSYRAMPWKRAKALPPPDSSLFEACFRIQEEASEAAGRYIPLIVENVKGAQPWVGRAKWHYGSYYLWGDIPALMPSTGLIKGAWDNTHRRKLRRLDGTKVANHTLNRVPGKQSVGFNVMAVRQMKAESGQKTRGIARQRESDAIKNGGNGTWFGVSHGVEYPGQPGNVRDGTKQHGSGPEWFDKGIAGLSSSGDARKRASAMIAKIPFPLAQHIARVFKEAPCV